MMKKIFSVAILALTLVAMPVSAQKQNNSETKKSEQCCEKKDGKKCDKKDGKKCEKKCDKKDEKKAEKKADLRSQREARMYEGMNLTDAQKQQLADLKEKGKKERREKMESQREERKKKADLSKEEREARKVEAEKARREYLKEFRKIVGDDNYIIFLENQYVQQNDLKVQPMKKGNKAEMHGPRAEKKSKAAKRMDFSKVKDGKKITRKIDKA